MNRVELRRLIAESVRLAFNEQKESAIDSDTSSSKPFGNELFGQELGRPNKNPEPNTPKEEDLKKDLKWHYNGSMDELNQWIPQLVQLRNQGKYKNVLQVPAKYKYAYRAMSDIKIDTLANMLPGEDGEALYETSLVPGKVYSSDGANYIDDGGNFKQHSSWTVDFDVIKAIHKDWGAIGWGDDFFVVLRAPVKSNNFIMNPDVTKFLSGKYDYQREVISVGNITCDKIWYVSQEKSSDYKSKSHQQAQYIDRIESAKKSKSRKTPSS